MGVGLCTVSHTGGHGTRRVERMAQRRRTGVGRASLGVRVTLLMNVSLSRGP